MNENNVCCTVWQYRSSIRVLSILLVLLSVSRSFAAADLVLNTGHNPPLANDDQSGFHDLVAIEAYRRLGLNVEIYRLPSARSGRNVDMGIDDGNGPRIEGYQNYFPNLIMVPEKIIDFDFVGFTRNPKINPQSWKELEDLNIGLVTGWKLLEVNIQKSQSLVKVRNIKQLFNLLKRDRVDIVLIERWQGLHAAKQAGITDLHVVDPPFANKAMYFYLHKKHANLVNKLAEAIRDMKEDGTYDQLVKEKLLPLVPH